MGFGDIEKCLRIYDATLQKANRGFGSGASKPLIAEALIGVPVLKRRHVSSDETCSIQ